MTANLCSSRQEALRFPKPASKQSRGGALQCRRQDTDCSLHQQQGCDLPPRLCLFSGISPWCCLTGKFYLQDKLEDDKEGLGTTGSGDRNQDMELEETSELFPCTEQLPKESCEQARLIDSEK